MRREVELEATVRTTFNHEVQVRVTDGELLWRTVKTTRLIAETIQSEGGEQAPLLAEAQPIVESETADGSTKAQIVVDLENAPQASPGSRKAKRRNRHPRNR